MFNSWSQKASGRLDEAISSSLRLSTSILKSPPVAALPRPPAPKDSTVEYLSALERRATQLQRQIQSLLDAQAELLAPRPGQRPDETSASQIMTASGVMPIRQPKKNRLGLQDIRKDITRAMIELSDLRLEEQEVLDILLLEKQSKAQQAQSFTDRRVRLQEEIDAIRQDPQSKRVDDLREEEGTVQEEINVMELQLSELRAKQTTIQSELSRLENSVQAKLSSYKGSLNMLDSEIQYALLETPARPMIPANSSSAFLTLPENRRTLEMMVELVRDEEQHLKALQESAKVEQEALEDGVSVWKSVVDAVTSFEGQLKREISQLAQRGDSAIETATSVSGSPGTDSIEGLIRHLSHVVTHVETKFGLAETRGYTLLMAAIGAELEALQQGHEILESLRPPQSSRSLSPEHEAAQDDPSVKDGQGSPPAATSVVWRRRDDDEPDPDLLLSTQDTDTEYESSV